MHAHHPQCRLQGQAVSDRDEPVNHAVFLRESNTSECGHTLATETDDEQQMGGKFEDSAINDEDSKTDEAEIDGKLLPIGLVPKYVANFQSVQEDDVEAASPVGVWSVGDATTFDVRRGPNYVSGQKSPSKRAFYEAFAMDTFTVPFKVNNITRFMDTDQVLDQHGVRGQCPLPQLLVINIMIPDYCPKLKQQDGSGYSVVIFAKLSQQIRQQLASGDALSPALKLLTRFVADCRSDPNTRDLFKCIGRVVNLKHTEFNWSTKKLIGRFNAKPFLAIGDTAFHISEDAQTLTIDVDVHHFGFMAKRAWNRIKDSMEGVVWDLAFLVQGESNEELPERILTTVRVSKVAVGPQIQKPLPQWALRRCAEKH